MLYFLDHCSNKARGIGTRQHLLYDLHLLQSPVACSLEGLHPSAQGFFPSFINPPYSPLNKGLVVSFADTKWTLWWSKRLGIVLLMLNMTSVKWKMRKGKRRRKNWNLSRDKIKKTFLKSIFVTSLLNTVTVSWGFRHAFKAFCLMSPSALLIQMNLLQNDNWLQPLCWRSENFCILVQECILLFCLIALTSQDLIHVVWSTLQYNSEELSYSSLIIFWSQSETLKSHPLPLFCSLFTIQSCCRITLV